jgi:hypothetical protein
MISIQNRMPTVVMDMNRMMLRAVQVTKQSCLEIQKMRTGILLMKKPSHPKPPPLPQQPKLPPKNPSGSQATQPNSCPWSLISPLTPTPTTARRCWMKRWN